MLKYWACTQLTYRQPAQMASNSSDSLYLSFSRIKSKHTWINISHLLIFSGRIFAYTLSWNNIDLRGGWSRLCVIQISITATQNCVRRSQDKLTKTSLSMLYLFKYTTKQTAKSSRNCVHAQYTWNRQKNYSSQA